MRTLRAGAGVGRARVPLQGVGTHPPDILRGYGAVRTAAAQPPVTRRSVERGQVREYTILQLQQAGSHGCVYEQRYVLEVP